MNQKRTKHIDGSNGSQAPAVFSLVHTPKGDLDDEAAAKTLYRFLINSYKYCSKECLNKSPSKRLCVACELKNVKLKERPKSEFKMAFKAGVPNNNKSVSLNNELNPNRLKIPKQRDPYSNTKYHIETLAPPFSFQSGKRHEYPNHWRLASIYQHSYKPLHLRKRPMIECVFK
ncbi:hypothetical protein MML48_4g00021730 [Holotrichia oblita]|uniref:Uncharacterized protein n=1 Tax=Holotrichia oblita TaxID=644536 RepID=A0ACB9TAT5_HOLOL|nr:hypothetical protein MML48_4g00021730 [Holotrichia oblita]